MTGRNAISGSLSLRLLILTVAFMMLGVVLLFAPAIARYRISYLEDRIDAAHLAIFALEATPDNMVSRELSNALLAHVGAHGIVVHMADRALMLAEDMPPRIDATYDLRQSGMMGSIGDAMATLFRRGNRVLRVLDLAPQDKSVTVEVILDEAPLHRDMWEFGQRVLAVSAAISSATAVLLYLCLQWLLVRPLKRLTASMMAFRDDPEDASRVIRPSARSDEIGLAQRELASMQETVRQALRQKEHLAALGTAVGKINHDLRGILSTVRLMSDSLLASAAPEVRKITPVLVAAIDRAVALCTATVSFTRGEVPPPRRSRFVLSGLVEELAGAPANGLALVNEVPASVMAEADRDQLYRALENLVRNAAEAGAKHCTIRAEQTNGTTLIEIGDDGPGMAPKARDNLFRPFAGSARPGGTGLGLAIAREVMRAHGGDIRLKDSNARGTVFALTLPEAALDS